MAKMKALQAEYDAIGKQVKALQDRQDELDLRMTYAESDLPKRRCRNLRARSRHNLTYPKQRTDTRMS